MKLRKNIFSYRDENSLSYFFREIYKLTPLNSQELEKIRSILQEGDDSVINNLIIRNLRFVVSVAKQYQGFGQPLPDLISEGCIGLIKAAQKYDPKRDNKFLSYAVWWIRRQIVAFLMEQAGAFRLPESKLNELYKMRKAIDYLEKILQRQPTAEEIAQHAQMKLDKVQENLTLLHQAGHQYLLDDYIGSDKRTTFADLLSDDDDPSSTVFIKHEVQQMLNNLSPKERSVIELLFGINQVREYNIQEVAAKLNISCNYVTILKKRALEKLQKKYKQNI